MSTIFQLPSIKNEAVLDYAPNSAEKVKLLDVYNEMYGKFIDIPMYIGGKEVRTGEQIPISPPHEHKHVLGHYHKGTSEHISSAIQAALDAKKDWEEMPWQDRVAIFLKAADLLAGPYRYKINAATMLGQSKNAMQAEIDSACELIDFLRFNVLFMKEIYQDQPISSPPIWNTLEYRALEGFVFALTPFNFTAIAGNLPTAPAMMGNTVVWKPSSAQVYSANVFMQVMQEAGLPDGVINLIYASGKEVGAHIFSHPEFSGLHFTGSTGVFRTLWKEIGSNIDKYKSYPRIVGETGGKDFIIAHESANMDALVTACTRGAYEFQGQKCSAASRAYIPKKHKEVFLQKLKAQMAELKIGAPSDFSNFVSAVIDRKAYDKITNYIEKAKSSKEIELIAGGNYSDEIGYFIHPTLFEAKNPDHFMMCEEIFGPVLTVYFYEDSYKDSFAEICQKADQTSSYALTGAIFARDREAILQAKNILRHSAGNFYINDKPTGAVVGQQPFGGARASGTNDKAGSKLNLMRWISPRTIKENFNPPTNYTYPFLQKD